MAEFNQFHILDVVSLTNNGSVSTARLDSQPGVLFALKQLQIAVGDPDEPQWEAQHFLDSARVQKGIVAAGGEYWLPVLGMGVNADGAWIATDYYPLSVQKLIDSRTRLSASELAHVIDGIVCGLVELKQTRARSHGNLKASNVILSPGDVAKSRVFLTDPLPGATRDEGEDLFIVGQIIYQLVEHRPFETGGELPPAENPAWARLGAARTKWRELCASLLAPSASIRPSLTELSWSIRELAGRKRRSASSSKPTTARRKFRTPSWVKKALVIIGSAAAVLVLGLVGLNLFYRNRLATARLRWADSFSAALDDPARRGRFMTDGDLRQVVYFLEDASLSRSHGQGFTSLFSLSGWADTRRAFDELALAEQGLSEQKWRRLGRLEDLRGQYEARGWKQPAAFLASVVNPAQTLGADLPAAIDRVLKVEPMIHTGTDAGEESWTKISNAAKNLEKPGDRTLTTFARSLREVAAQRLTISETSVSGTEELRADAALGTKLDRVTSVGWPGNVDAQRLAIDLGFNAKSGKLSRPDMEHWLASLPQYTLCTTDTAMAAGILSGHLKDIDDLIVKSPPTPDEKSAFSQAREQVQARIEVFSKTRFVTKELATGVLGSRRDAIDSDITSLRRFARAETVAELAKGFPAIATRSNAVNEYWNKWKLKAFSESLDGKSGSLMLLKNRASEMQSLLTDIDQEVPIPTEELSGPYHSAAGHEREAQITKLLVQINPETSALDPLFIATVAANYVEWSGQLKKLSLDFPIRKQILGAHDRLDEKWRAEGNFLDDPEIKTLIAPDVERINGVRRLATASRTQLIATAQLSDVVEQALEAYHRLGEGNIDPVWPTGSTELSTDHDMRVRIEKLLTTISNVDERAEPLQFLHDEAPERWRRVVEHARETQTLGAAWTLRQTFSIDDAQLDTLTPVTRYNVWLYRTREDLSSNDAAALAISARRLSDAAVAMGDAESAKLAASLRESGGNALLAGKTGEVIQLAIAGAPVPLEFRRVDIADSLPVYLATTELSVGQFTGIVEAAKQWDTVGKLPWPTAPGQPEQRRGPRSWEWTTGTPARFAPPQLWLAREEDNDFAPSLRVQRFNRMTLNDAAGGMPSPAHPMQQISAASAMWFANLTGCRLPTSAEWLAAYNQFEKNTPPTQLNLRDLTWELQRQYSSQAKATAGARWPFPDIFRGDDDATVPAQNDYRTGRNNDGELLFRPVDSPAGAAFHNLVGNVAEYVFDDAEASATLKDSKDPAAFVNFATANTKSLHVIGGSALSQPDVPVDQPQPVSHPDRGYADVGLRLAISAEPRTLAQRVKWALRKQDYRWPGPSIDSNNPSLQVKLER